MPDRLMRRGWASQARAKRARLRQWLRLARLFAPLLMPVGLAAAAYAFTTLGGVGHQSRAARPRTATAPAGALRVVDGDTVRFRGERLRLLVIDAPEIGSPRCAAEYRAGLAAKAELHAFLLGRQVDIWYSGRRDVFNRPLVRLSVDGNDVGAHLLSRDLATRYAFGKAISKMYWCGSW